MPTLKKDTLLKTFWIFLSAIVLSAALYIPRFIRAASGDTKWVGVPISETPRAHFQGIATDGEGGYYVVGNLIGEGTVNFGNEVNVSVGVNGGALIVKYNSSGVAQWAKSVSVSAPNDSEFRGVAVDSNGDIYVVGLIGSKHSFDFGNGITATGGNINANTLIVKYNSSGVAQWAKTIGAESPGGSNFEKVAVDSSGVYAVGVMVGTDSYDFGNGVNVSGGNEFTNPVIVKYNFSGDTQWAKSTDPGATGYSHFSSVAVGGTDIYVVGDIYSGDPIGFGNDVDVSGGNDSGSGFVIKYNSSGVAQWARSTTTGSSTSQFYGVTADLANVYVAGRIDGVDSFDFGDGISTTGGHADGSAVLVKYNSSGVAQWAKSTGAGAASCSQFNGVSFGGDGVYAVGSLCGAGEFNFGGGTVLTGMVVDNDNLMIVKYDLLGNAKWGKSIENEATASSYYYDAVIDNSGIYVVGDINGTGSFDFGNGIVAIGTNEYNTGTIVKYEPIVTVALPDSESSNSSSGQATIQIPEMSSGLAMPAVVGPAGDSQTGGQGVVAVVFPNVFEFDAFLSAKTVEPKDIVTAALSESSKTESSNLSSVLSTSAVFAGGGNGTILGVKNYGKVSWQVGNIENIWFKAYPAPGMDAPIIIPEVQNNDSIIALKYKREDLIPPGHPNTIFPESKLRIAHSLDGKNWTIAKLSVVDPITNTVATIGKLGGYYMIVGNY